MPHLHRQLPGGGDDEGPRAVARHELGAVQQLHAGDEEGQRLPRPWVAGRECARVRTGLGTAMCVLVQAAAPCCISHPAAGSLQFQLQHQQFFAVKPGLVHHLHSAPPPRNQPASSVESAAAAAVQPLTHPQPHPPAHAPRLSSTPTHLSWPPPARRAPPAAAGWCAPAPPSCSQTPSRQSHAASALSGPAG